MKKLIGFMIIILVAAGITYITVHLDNKEEISNKFADQLFHYPLPPQTKMIEQEQVNGKQLVWGNSGNWGVIASVKFSTKLSREDILAYYKNAVLFKYPKSNERGVEPEVYFQGYFKKEEQNDGFYYEGVNAMKEPLHNISKGNQEEHSGKTMEYVVQLTNEFDYFLKMD